MKDFKAVRQLKNKKIYLNYNSLLVLKWFQNFLK